MNKDLIIGISGLMDSTGKIQPYLIVLDTGENVLTTKVALPSDQKYYDTPYHPIYGDLLEGETVESVREAIESFTHDYAIHALKDEENSSLLKGMEVNFHDIPVEYNPASEEAITQIIAIKRLKELA